MLKEDTPQELINEMNECYFFICFVHLLTINQISKIWLIDSCSDYSLISANCLTISCCRLTVTRFGPKVGQIDPKWDKSVTIFRSDFRTF